MPKNSTAQRVGTSKERSQSRWGELLRPTACERDLGLSTAERFSPLAEKRTFAVISTGPGRDHGAAVDRAVPGRSGWLKTPSWLGLKDNDFQNSVSDKGVKLTLILRLPQMSRSVRIFDFRPPMNWEDQG